MAHLSLTPEQKAIVDHPPGKHARILAVAGSGKTTTMAYRVKHLLDKNLANPDNILVIMFNKLARAGFKETLEGVGVSPSAVARVHTFHSHSYHIMNKMIARGLIVPPSEEWTEGAFTQGFSGQLRLTVLQAVSNLKMAGVIAEEAEVNIDEVISAISLYKAYLITPSRAGYKGAQNYVPELYQEFEKLRKQANAISWDDFVPMAVAILEHSEEMNADIKGPITHLIVDEYQDINFGQHRLIELIAAKAADVMVVGDDDQTVYEWRGARPDYIIKLCKERFSNKPFVDYKLSHSFRFGPVLAQCGENVIRENATRASKGMVADHIAKKSSITIVDRPKDLAADANDILADDVQALIESGEASPSNIIVICRMYAQLAGLQTKFLARGIPYHVIDQAPFFERTEIQSLLDYYRFARELDQTASISSREMVVRTINKPYRMIARTTMEALFTSGMQSQFTNRQILEQCVDNQSAGRLNPGPRSNMQAYLSVILELNKYAHSEHPPFAGQLLTELVEKVNYWKHFDNYYGEGEESIDRKHLVREFLNYAISTELPMDAFLKIIDGHDPSQGTSKEKQVAMATAFKLKGLEWDHVIIPDCNSGLMPCKTVDEFKIYDTSGKVVIPAPTEGLESERRIFYVAITRARKTVLIGTVPTERSPFIQESRVDHTSTVMSRLQQAASATPDASIQGICPDLVCTRNSADVLNAALTYLPRIEDQSRADELHQCIKNILAGKLRDMNLADQDLTATDLRGVDLTEANLSKANLTESSLAEAHMISAILAHATLSYADLTNANLSNADLSNTNLSNANLGEANLSLTNLRKADLSKAELSKATLVEANLREAILAAANVSEADLSKAEMSEAVLVDANLRGASLQESSLRGANLSAAVLRGANLHGANLSAAVLRRASLQHADVSQADLHGADLGFSNLEQANLSECILANVDLAGAKYNSGTRWPEGFDPEVAGAVLVR